MVLALSLCIKMPLVGAQPGVGWAHMQYRHNWKNTASAPNAVKTAVNSGTYQPYWQEFPTCGMHRQNRGSLPIALLITRGENQVLVLARGGSPDVMSALLRVILEIYKYWHI